MTLDRYVGRPLPRREHQSGAPIIMKTEEIIYEDSPDTPVGSQSKDLNLGKLYLCRCLKRLGLDQFDNVYALGSWYGSIAQYMLNKNIVFNQLFLIDIDPNHTNYVKNNAVSDSIIPVTQDCNKTVFEPGNTLIINTSTNDIQGEDWFDHIPPGSIVALQGRDQQWDNQENLYQTIESFDSAFPLTETYCLSEIPLVCWEGTEYNRFTKVGRK